MSVPAVKEEGLNFLSYTHFSSNRSTCQSPVFSFRGITKPLVTDLTGRSLVRIKRAENNQTNRQPAAHDCRLIALILSEISPPVSVQMNCWNKDISSDPYQQRATFGAGRCGPLWALQEGTQIAKQLIQCVILLTALSSCRVTVLALQETRRPVCTHADAQIIDWLLQTASFDPAPSLITQRMWRGRRRPLSH